tara:strand:+ start:4815 stop:9353 length:4539 start_codon:yes stop_codon:yes gene_type:complete
VNRDSQIVIIALLILLLTSWSPLIKPVDSNLTENEKSNNRFEIININPNQLNNLDVVDYKEVDIKRRPSEAWTRIGIFNADEFIPSIKIPDDLMTTRDDLNLVIINGEVPLTSARQNISSVEGVVIREYIWPSGYVVQGPHSSLDKLKSIEDIERIHSIPLALILGDVLLELINQNQEEKLDDILIRIDGWRNLNGEGFHENIEIFGVDGDILSSDLSKLVQLNFDEIVKWDEGRFDGKIINSKLVNLLSNPSIAWLRISPEFTVYNDNSRSHMKWSSVTSYFPTNGLNGSGQLIAVADTGIDHDHGDFGNRILSKHDVVNDGGKTGDKWSGHGTHVACTVLGDGTRGGYAGVAPQAELYFQAMEDDDNGNFYSPSITSLLGNAYTAGARIHSNSWGSFGTSSQGAYTSESEDVDDKANTYDRYYNGYQGFSVVFAAGNDGPNSGTVNSPGTAKNPITVGMHQSRYGSAPNTIMSGSSRGPTDDDRIKPDVLAPGGYVRSCKSQEAQDDGTSTWDNQYYMEYTGTSMATPNTAGAAALVREYLTEVAQRPSPQGALMKAMLILGAQDIGTRNIPNNDEGWGRINLQNSIAPSGGRGIWVDDRSRLSNSGTSIEYNLNVTSPGSPFKVVLAWSDHLGSRFSSKQLVNDLNLEVEAPDGTIYLGNVFQNGRSISGGNADDTNNVEVILVDNAQTGLWKITVSDVQHGGPRSQMFAIAASGIGINDLRPDILPTPESLILSKEIPNIGDEVQLSYEIINIGNTAANSFNVELSIDDNLIESYELSLDTGAKTVLTWDWIADSAGIREVKIHVDADEKLEETDENNNIYFDIIRVTTPGININAKNSIYEWNDTNSESATWVVNLTNTAFISTNTSLESSQPIQRNTLIPKEWPVSLSSNNQNLEGRESVEIDVILTIPSSEFPPEPGYYDINIIGKDVDNDIEKSITISLYVQNLPFAIISASNQILVSPLIPTEFNLTFINGGNSVQGYNLILEAPEYWNAYFKNNINYNEIDTGLLSKSENKILPVVINPPTSLISAGTKIELNVKAISQSNPNQVWDRTIELVVGTYELINIVSNMSLGTVMPDERLNLSVKLINNGNSITSVTVDAILPKGWIVLTYTKFYEIEPNSFKDVVIPVQGNGQAKSGNFKLIISTLEGSMFEWDSNLEVLYLPTPTIEFLDFQNSNGTIIQVDEGEKLPVGTPFLARWVISNDGEVNFTPEINLETTNNWMTSCRDIGTVQISMIEIADCEVVIPLSAVAGEIETFNLILSFENNYAVNYSNNLSVPLEFKLSWQEVSIPLSEYNKISEVEFEVTNLGNEQISDKLEIIAPDGWLSNFEDSNWVVLEPGESKRIKIKLTPMDVGTFKIELKLLNNNQFEGSINSFNIISKSNEEYNLLIESEKNSSSTIIVALILLISIISFIVVLIPKNNLFVKNNKKSISTNLQPHTVQKNLANLNLTTIESLSTSNLDEVIMSTVAKEKMELYIKQLISSGYPEDKAREHAMNHKEKFSKL